MSFNHKVLRSFFKKHLYVSKLIALTPKCRPIPINHDGRRQNFHIDNKYYYSIRPPSQLVTTTSYTLHHKWTEAKTIYCSHVFRFNSYKYIDFGRFAIS